MKNLTLIFLFITIIFTKLANATVIENVKILNNDRISKETIITYGDIKLKRSWDIYVPRI